MSDDNDTQDDDFTTEETSFEAAENETVADFNAEEATNEVATKKRTGWLKFLTTLMLVMAIGLFVFPFVWGLENKSPDKITPDPSVLNDWLWWLGDMHVLVLHIPIGVFIWVLTLEGIGLLTFRKFKPHLGGTLFFASITSVIAVVFGYFYFLRGDYGGAALQVDFDQNRMGMHMWLSILFAFFVILSFVSKMWSRHNDKGSPFYPFFLILAAASMTVGAHMGGKLVHPTKDIEGDFKKLIAGEPLGVAEDEIVKMPVVTDIPANERLVFAEIVKPILHGKCWECHADADLNPLGKKKIKGGLVMTSVADLLKGGKGGEDFPSLIPGDSENSEMMVRVNLDTDDDEFMPTGKEDEPHMHFTEGEKRIMAWWIDNTPLIDEAGDKPLSEVAGFEAILSDVEAFEPVRDAGPAVKVDESQVAAEKKKMETAEADRRAMIEKDKAMVDKELPGALTFSSKDSEDLYFTSVSQGKEFNDEGLSKLVPVAEQIIDLDVKKTAVSDKGMETVVKMLNLDKLMLNETKVTDAGLKTISDLPNLRSLSLFGTEVTDKGIAELSRMSSLKSVYLSNTKVTKAGVEELRKSLPEAMIEFTDPSLVKPKVLPKKMVDKKKAPAKPAPVAKVKKAVDKKPIAQPKVKPAAIAPKIAEPLKPAIDLKKPVPAQVAPTEKKMKKEGAEKKKMKPVEAPVPAPKENTPKKVAPKKVAPAQPTPKSEPAPAKEAPAPAKEAQPAPKVEPTPQKKTPQPKAQPLPKQDEKVPAGSPIEKKSKVTPAPDPVEKTVEKKVEKKAPQVKPVPKPKPVSEPAPEPAPVPTEKVVEKVEVPKPSVPAQKVAPRPAPKEKLPEVEEPEEVIPETSAEEEARAAIERLREIVTEE